MLPCLKKYIFKTDNSTSSLVSNSQNIYLLHINLDNFPVKNVLNISNNCSLYMSYIFSGDGNADNKYVVGVKPE